MPIWVHEIDDDPAFDAEVVVPENASRAVAVAADLIDREVNQHRWVANDPFFQPGYLLDNMPAYQTGIDERGRAVHHRVARPGRAGARLERGRPRSGERRRAAQLSGRRVDLRVVAARPCSRARRASIGAAWRICAATTSGWPRARRSTSGGRTICWRRWTGSPTISARASAALTQEVDEGTTNFLDFNADNLFYSIKGKLYAYYLILRELEQDFADVIKEKNLQASWAELLTSLRLGATLYPWMVSNGPLDSMATPNHLAAEGFLLLRVRTKLEEIIDILRT